MTTAEGRPHVRGAGGDTAPSRRDSRSEAEGTPKGLARARSDSAPKGAQRAASKRDGPLAQDRTVLRAEVREDYRMPLDPIPRYSLYALAERWQ